MALAADGLVKLIEECGELQQIVAKKLAYYGIDTHPDGNGSIKQRLEEEVADVLAAASVVMDFHNLDVETITRRQAEKMALFHKWRNES